MHEEQSDAPACPLDLIAEITDAIGLTELWQKDYLDEQLRFLPGVVKSFRTTKLATPPSEFRQNFEQIERRAEALLGAIGVTVESSDPSELDQVIAKSNKLALFLYHFSAAMDASPAEHRIYDGTARAALRTAISGLRLIRRAAISAGQSIEPHVAQGKGGARRGPDHVVQQTAEHLLHIYHTLTREKPGFTVALDGGEVSGPAPFFLMRCLSHVGIRISDSTIRRLIEDFVRSHPSA